MKEFDYKSEIRVGGPATPGAAPGMLSAPEGSPPCQIDVTLATRDGAETVSDLPVEQIQNLREKREGLLWVDVNGLGTPEVLLSLGKSFGFHRLSLEDVVHLHQRPKVEGYADHIFVVVQVPFLDEEGLLNFEQVSLFAGEGFLISFQSSSIPRLSALTQRFQSGARLRASESDYALYAALDVLTDANFPVLEALDQRVEQLEAGLLEGSTSQDLMVLQRLRRDLTLLRRILWNLREIPAYFLRPDVDGIHEDTRPYFRDVEDHAVRLLERAEQLRESCTGLFELHLSVSGDKLNEVMKLLTIISTVFIPLTFLAGIYGMNFDYMPELAWWGSYPLVLLVMLASSVTMLALFKGKGWLTRKGLPK